LKGKSPYFRKIINPIPLMLSEFKLSTSTCVDAFIPFIRFVLKK
jgi:hypothetical protein